MQSWHVLYVMGTLIALLGTALFVVATASLFSKRISSGILTLLTACAILAAVVIMTIGYAIVGLMEV